MDIAWITEYFAQYGLVFLFVIVLLEYMNLPGFPAGIIMPAAGVLISTSDLNFINAIIVSVVAGLMGCWITYGVGRYGGGVILAWYLKRFPRQQKYIDKSETMLLTHGNKVLFVCKLIPAVRTIIGIPAGVLKMNFKMYTIYSTLGIFIWNFVLIWIGYYFANAFLA